MRILKTGKVIESVRRSCRGDKGHGSLGHANLTRKRDPNSGSQSFSDTLPHQASIMSHCQSLRIALYRVFVRPALLNPSIPCLLPGSAYQSRSISTVQWPPTEPSQQDTAINDELPKKRSYKDRIAEREAARSPFAK